MKRAKTYYLTDEIINISEQKASAKGYKSSFMVESLLRRFCGLPQVYDEFVEFDGLKLETDVNKKLERSKKNIEDVKNSLLREFEKEYVDMHKNTPSPDLYALRADYAEKARELGIKLDMDELFDYTKQLKKKHKLTTITS